MKEVKDYFESLNIPPVLAVIFGVLIVIAALFIIAEAGYDFGVWLKG